jgi:predicted ATP-grasp superfamily ATP-dependent carboligase
MRHDRTTKRVLLLSEENAVTIIYCAARAGYRIVVAGRPERNEKIIDHPLCEKFISLKHDLRYTEMSEALVEELEAIIDAEQIDVLMPSSFDCIKILADCRERLLRRCAVMPTSNIKTILMLDNKNTFHEFCRRFDLPHPKSIYVEDAATLAQLKLDADLFPALWKPVWGAGEKLMRFANVAAFEESKSALRSESGKMFPALVQKYFDGEDIDFNGFAAEGVVRASSVMRTTGCRTATGAFTITDFVDNPEVERLGCEIVRLSAFSGPLNIDMRISAEDGRVYLIEVNPRFWDRTVTSLIDDMNFVEVGIRLAETGNASVASKKGSACWVSPVSGLVMASIAFGPKVLSVLAHLSVEQLKFLAFTAYARMYGTVRRVFVGAQAALVKQMGLGVRIPSTRYRRAD